MSTSASVDVLVASEFVRKLRGGSQAILVRANDGVLYVLKFAHNLQGPNLLFNEVMGAELYRAYGLPVPEWRPLLVTDSFLDHNPACWFYTGSEFTRPIAGLCFGSRFLGGADDNLIEILPGGYFSRVTNRRAFGLAWMIDACAQHCDNRQALFVRNPKGELQAVFIDHGHMFGGPQGHDRPPLAASHYLDPRIYLEDLVAGFRRVSDKLDASSLWSLLRALPADWYCVSALDRFSTCIACLTDPESLRKVRDSIVDQYRRICVHEGTDRRPGRSAAVLCTGIRRAAVRRCTIA